MSESTYYDCCDSFGTHTQKCFRSAVKERAAALVERAKPEPSTDLNRCAVCGWPLAESRDKGCARGDCSQRPFPEHFYDPQRAKIEYTPYLDNDPRTIPAQTPSPDGVERAAIESISKTLRGVVEGFKNEAINGVICTPPCGEYTGVGWDDPPNRTWCERCKSRWQRLFKASAELSALLLAFPSGGEKKETQS